MTSHALVLARSRLVVPALVALVLTASAAAQCSGTKITASDAAAGDEFGMAVATNGATIAVGSPFDDDAGVDAGAGYLYDEATGAELVKLVATDGAAGDRFGIAVAASASTVVVGAIDDDDNGVNSGSAYLFDAATGAQLFKLVPADGAADDSFGAAVAVSGTTVVVGSPFDDDNGADSGSAYVFDATTGTEVMKLTPSDGAAGDLFGAAVAISGTTAVVTAPVDDDNGAGSGSVYVFDVTTGTELFKLLASDGAAGDGLGQAVALDGTTALVGARLDGDNGPESGSAYVFDVATGTETGKIVPADGAAFDEFGFAVAISGTRAVIGARLDDEGAADTGSIYVYDAPSGTLIAKLLAADAAASDELGTAVAASATAIIGGANHDDDAGADSGSVYAFDPTALQRFAGTSEDFVMETSVNGAGVPSTPCKDASVSDAIVVRFLSPGGTFDFTLPLLVAQAFVATNPPSPVFPGIAIDPGISPGPVLLFGGGVAGSPVGPLVVPPGGIAVAAIVPPPLSGQRVLFQAYSLTAIAANGNFASTEGHVLNIL